MVRAVDVPVTLKIRTGYTRAGRNGMRIARKHLGWYAKDRAENAAYRAVVNGVETAADQLRLTGCYFEHLAERPRMAA